MLALLAGVGAGLLHVLGGPDHLAAVAPLAADQDRTQWRAGFQWGIGHTAGVMLVGVALIAFRELLPIDAISAYSERLVGAALIAVGIWGAVRARRLQVHRHHDGHVHAHVKPAAGAAVAGHHHQAQHQHPKLHGHARTRASFAMGTLHGLAGSSHLFGVLPALALPSQADAVAYLTGFGIGAVAAMTAFAALVGLLSVRAGSRGAHAYGGVLYACSASAVLVGGVWLLG
jgi:hypothetical protein